MACYTALVMAARGGMTEVSPTPHAPYVGVHGSPYQAVLIRHLLDRYAPGFGGALAHLALNVLGSLIRRSTVRIDSYQSCTYDTQRSISIDVRSPEATAPSPHETPREDGRQSSNN